MALSRGNLALVRCLIELGADVEALILLLSAQSADYPMMLHLLEREDANLKALTMLATLSGNCKQST
jgi:hypothetical protein